MNAVAIEQKVRDLLTLAIRGGLVSPREGPWDDDPDPQLRSAGELVGVANLLGEYVREVVAEAAKAERERCIAAMTVAVNEMLGEDDGHHALVIERAIRARANP